MPKIRFGCFLIPEDGHLYQIGSSVVGYDIRASRPALLPEFIQPEWQTGVGDYGFHISITDAITIDSEKLPEVRERVEELLGCFKPSNRYVVTTERAGFWDDKRPDAALITRPNREVEMLHDVLVTSLHPLGSGSDYVGRFDDEKTKHFYSPYIFDDFIPHFSLINNFQGTSEQRREVETELARQFAAFGEIEFQSLALVVQEQGDDYFRIEQEFPLQGER